MAQGDIPEDAYALTVLFSKLNCYKYFVVSEMSITVTSFKSFGVVSNIIYKMYL